MALFDPHIDRELGPIGSGSISPRRFRRVVQHARLCHRCASRYERSIRVLRQLENRSPFEPAQVELDSLEALNAPRRPFQPGPRWVFGVLALPLAAALVLLWWPGATDGEFAVRGGGAALPVALRVFCGGNGAPLVEVREGGSCGAGQSLAFAVGAAPSHSQLVVRVRGVTPEAAVEMVVRAPPGAEESVALTAPLLRAGEVEVVAAFAGDAPGAAAAARGEPGSGALVLRRVIPVRP